MTLARQRNYLAGMILAMIAGFTFVLTVYDSPANLSKRHQAATAAYIHDPNNGCRFKGYGPEGLSWITRDEQVEWIPVHSLYRCDKLVYDVRSYDLPPRP